MKNKKCTSCGHQIPKFEEFEIPGIKGLFCSACGKSHMLRQFNAGTLPAPDFKALK